MSKRAEVDPLPRPRPATIPGAPPLLPPPPSMFLDRVFLILPLAAFSFVGCSVESGPTPPRHVVLISLDTFRTDHLGCYGNRKVTTPRIDAFAGDSALFRSATSAASTTLSSHTSMMTGLYPRRHGVVRNGFMVNPENVMLAEALSEEGFHCAAFLGSFALDRLFDFNQGFAHFDSEFDIEIAPGAADQNQRRAESVTDAVLDHLDELGDEADRLFLFVHYFDAHSPYDPPEPFGTPYIREGGLTTSDHYDISRQVVAHQMRLIKKPRNPYSLGLTPQLVHGVTGEKLPGDEDLAALYAGEVSYLDHHLGRLLDGLEERGVLKDSLVVLTGDHGETFWEHGDFWHHGASVYETNVHVPLLVRMPDGCGLEIEDPVSTVDVYPTVLDLIGVSLPEGVDGISLAPALEGGSLPERATFSEATQPLAVEKDGLVWANQFKSKSVRRGKWKYIDTPYLQTGELFDLEVDPGERINLIRQPTPASREQLPALRRLLVDWMKEPTPRASHYNSAQVDEVNKRLTELGYTGGEEQEDQGEKGGR
jgi:arylsulfatase A-like enzyme